MEMILATDRCAHKVQVKDKEGQTEAVVDRTSGKLHNILWVEIMGLTSG